jgi:hypothetical protein
VNCTSCLDWIIGDRGAGLCPGSGLLLASLEQCVSQFCATACGEDQSDLDACEDCLSASCPEATEACLNDTGHGL